MHLDNSIDDTFWKNLDSFDSVADHQKTLSGSEKDFSLKSESLTKAILLLLL